MTAKAKKAVAQFHSERFMLRDKVAAYLAKSTPAERLEMLQSVGVLTKSGKLAPAYRPSPKAA